MIFSAISDAVGYLNYLHGASTYNKDLPVTYILLEWQAEARQYTLQYLKIAWMLLIRYLSYPD